ncbi:O-antigen biosynthesis protein OS=Castellaniella defragrans (strain DSM / CCUG 39792 / 65Phen)OX=1437824 GN=BN940_10656 PE=3 SV=1 [Castellaniella denitrificans]
MAMDFETAQSEHSPLVSVVIPAFRAKYLQATLDSSVAQDFSDYEVVVGDDCPSDEVFDLLRKFSEDARMENFRYHRNETPLGGGSNFSACIRKARGKYIKPVFDDDFLLPGALSAFVRVLERNEHVAVVGSCRLLVDEHGERLPDNVVTVSLFDEDVIVHGRDVVSFLGDVTLNFIGEPSSIMFRRSDYPGLVEHGGLFKLGGQFIEWLGDLTMTVKLLRHGDLAFFHRPYSAFRVSKDQYSQKGRDQPGIGEKGHSDFKRKIRELGWYRAKDNHLVRIRPLNDDPKQGFSPIDLRARIHDRAKTLAQKEGAKGWGVTEWLADRTPSAARVLALQTLLQANPDVGTLGAAVIVPDGADVQALVATLESLGAQHRPVDGVWLIGGGNIPDEAAGNGIELLRSDVHWTKQLSDRIGQGGMPDFLWILHVGDRLVPHATLTMGEYRLRKPDPLVWYADEAVLQADAPANPMLKPDFNVDLLRSYPYIGRNPVISTAAIQAVGGLDGRVADLAPIDLIWRLVEQVGPPVVAHVPEVLQLGGRSLMDWVRDPETMTWFPAVTQAHFVRMGLIGSVHWMLEGEFLDQWTRAWGVAPDAA